MKIGGGKMFFTADMVVGSELVSPELLHHVD